MHRLKITAATRAGSPHVASEDRARTAPGLIVVVDGAETLGGTYAGILGEEVLTLAGDPGTDLRTALAEAIGRTAKALDHTRLTPLAICRLRTARWRRITAASCSSGRPAPVSTIRSPLPTIGECGTPKLTL
ncbi:hypothetical protein [Kitasatospora sp. GP82]|uniref:hypothetical protein n=1 Tax=Kitasatospora sp. GP82 TaxID=3035089 RepID=UPI0024735E66|nr:hypothetical protein [Kitasatospora sp. GP82]MDH6128840.1 hypothetical protein [Kitasatospora sp. GP82]